MPLSKAQIEALDSAIYPFIKKYPGQTLGQIAELPNNEGIKYLDWLIGQDWLRPNTKAEITAYLQHFWKAEWEEIALDG